LVALGKILVGVINDMIRAERSDHIHVRVLQTPVTSPRTTWRSAPRTSLRSRGAVDQILVKVRAASVNPYDWHFVEGTPKIMRLMGVGLRKPKDTRLGVTLPERLKRSVRTLPRSNRDDVSRKGGAFAEYGVGAAEGAVALKPANLTLSKRLLAT